MEINSENRYYSLDSYYKEVFGEKIYKLSLDGGFTCPNRDGTLGIGGCIFCNGGSGFFSEKAGTDINEEIEAAKLRVKDKARSDRYIAYFQNFSNTYAPLDRLEKLYHAVLERDDIVGLSVGTRPDCLGNEVTELLASLNKIKPVFVELGFQSAKEETAALINRCYPNATYFDAADRLKNQGINVVTHVILGFPWETEEDMLNSVKMVAAHTDGIKIHMLNILKGTKLAEMDAENHYALMSLAEYTSVLEKAVSILPRHIVIHRFTGDPPKKLLEKPLWTADKKHVLNYIKKQFEIDGILQGSGIK